MKKYLNLSFILVLTMAIGLSGCGKKKKHSAPPPYGPGNTRPYTYFDGCSQPNFGADYQNPPRRVQGVIGNGALITLDLYQGAGNSYHAMGRIEIASVETLYGYNVGGSTTIASCLMTEVAGSVSGGVYGDISMVLKGQGVQVTLGKASWGGIDTYIRQGDESTGELLGNIWLTIANHGQANTPFIMGAQ